MSFHTPSSYLEFMASIAPAGAPAELIVDNFAGGGGASEGIEQALRMMKANGALPFGAPDQVSIAINHDAPAIAMHKANHPNTLHLTHDVWKVDPIKVTNGIPVGLLWASPDCKHFSRAKGGKPVSREIRDLAWVVVSWAAQVRPRLILLENVPEFREWGPLISDGKGGEKPCPDRRGEIFSAWIAKLQSLGYAVEWKELRACDYGAPTLRKRLYLIARCDGKPIVWPAPTHSPVEVFEAAAMKPHRLAADIIEWDRPTPTIFMNADDARQYRKQTGVKILRPLAYNTEVRIAKSISRFVIKATKPYYAPSGDAATSVEMYGRSSARRLDAPLSCVTPKSPQGLVTACLTQNNAGVIGHSLNEPLSTIVGKGSTQSLVAASMLSLKGSDRRDARIDQPHPTITAGGQHSALLTMPMNTLTEDLTEEQIAGALRVSAFLRSHGCWDGGDFVIVDGRVMVDIGFRMLSPRELARAQGFRDDYILDAPFEGGRLGDTDQRHKIGNSVCPDVATALVMANYDPMGYDMEADDGRRLAA